MFKYFKTHYNPSSIISYCDNSKFNGIDFYNASIKYIIENTKSLRHNKLVVVMDHMFMRNNLFSRIANTFNNIKNFNWGGLINNTSKNTYTV